MWHKISGMKLLVAVDESEESDKALAYATDIADAMESPITAAYAVDPSIYEQGGSQPIASLSDADERLLLESIEDAEDRAFDILDDAVALAEDLGHDIETENVRTRRNDGTSGTIAPPDPGLERRF